MVYQLIVLHKSVTMAFGKSQNCLVQFETGKISSAEHLSKIGASDAILAFHEKDIGFMGIVVIRSHKAKLINLTATNELYTKQKVTRLVSQDIDLVNPEELN